MTPKVIIDDNGLLVTTMSGPWALADGRLKCALVIKVRGKCRKAIRRDVVLARTREALDQAVQDRLTELKIECYPVLIDMIRKGEISQLRLDDYMTMRGSLIARRGKWAGRTQQRSQQWDNKLAPVFEGLDVLSVNESHLVDAMERVYHRRRKKSGYSDEEKEAWIILDDLMRCAADVDGLIDNNPAHRIAKICRKRATTDALTNLAQRSLSWSALMVLVERCLPHIEDDNVYPAILAQLLHPVDVDELLGLNIGHWMREDAGEVSWLEITQAYQQRKAGVPVLSKLLDSANAYRRVVCTSQAEWVMARHVLARLAAGATEEDPMYVDANGERLSPNMYKQKRDRLIIEALDATGQNRQLYLGQTGSKYRGQSAYYRGDLIRGTAIHHCRTCAKIDDTKLAAMLGIDRSSTYARYYVDWSNPELMLATKHQLEQWHQQIITCCEDSTLQCGKPGLRCQEMIFKIKCSSRTTMDLRAVGGLTVVATKL